LTSDLLNDWRHLGCQVVTPTSLVEYVQPLCKEPHT